MFGGNKSAEDEGECAEDSKAVSGVNIVLAHRLTETGFKNKKDFQKVMKVYVLHVCNLCTFQVITILKFY